MKFQEISFFYSTQIIILFNLIVKKKFNQINYTYILECVRINSIESKENQNFWRKKNRNQKIIAGMAKKLDYFVEV